MGCCSSNTKVKNPTQTNQDTPMAQKRIDKQKTVEELKVGSKGNHTPQIPNKERIDTPQMTGGQDEPPEQNSAMNHHSKNLGLPGKPKNFQYFDISPKVLKKNKIYHITNLFPVSKPYSNQSDWQKLLSKSLTMSEEEMILKILGLRNRNWIQEQIKLQIETQSQNTGSLEGLVTSRRSIQLREHFNWLVWAVAQFYFQQKFENKFNFPKLNSNKWSLGFEFKGIYVRVLPYEDAYFVHNEMMALKYVQVELHELSTLSPLLSQQYGPPKEQVEKDILLPLLSGVSCGGFYLYASPIIYTQELDTTKEFFRDTFSGSKVAGLQNSIVQMPLEKFNMNYSSAQQMQAIQNQSNVSFSYLHNNINPDFVQDSLFKYMPILKNIQTKNMIPIIDFDEFNDKGKSEDQRFENMDLKYLLVNLFDVLPQLSETSASTLLLRFPYLNKEELSFFQFPKNNYMEIQEIKNLMKVDGDPNEDAKDNYADHNSFTKKFFTKHGWDFIMMQKAGATNENIRATNFFNQREIPIRMQGNENQNGGTGKNNILLIDDYNGKEEQQEQHSRYISPQKQTILRKIESVCESKVYGNVLVSAYNFRKDFKIQYSMNGHSYSTNIESLFSASVDQVAKIIESSDNIYNSLSLKELMHRKGLNMRFLWVVLTKLRVNQFRELIMIDIFMRTMRRIVNEEMKLRCKIQHQQVIDGGVAVQEEYYQGNQLDVYKEVLILYMNAILKRKFRKQKQIFDETLLGLFLSRMQVMGILFSLNLKKEEIFYFESRDILEDIIEAPSKNPVLFINAVQNYFKIDFKQDFQRICRQDKYLMLSKSQPITTNDIKQIQLKFHTYFTIKEYSYFLLARSITHHSKGSPQKLTSKIKTKSDKDKFITSFQKPRPNDSTTQSQSSRVGKGSQIGRPGMGNTMNDSSTQVEKEIETTTRNNFNGHNPNFSQTTLRQYSNMDKEVDEFTSPPMNSQKLSKLNGKPQQTNMDMYKISKRSSFKPTQVQEIIMPSILYKLKTFLSNNPMHYFDDSSKTYIGDTFTVLKAYYEMPNIDIVNEWVICMESLLKEVYSVGGNEQVLLEAFVYQFLLIYFFEKDQESLYKVLAKIRDQLFQSSYCSPEIIVVVQILTGLYFEEQKEQHPIEAEKSYLTSLICIFQLYGDPRGRGNIGIPYTLYLSWKLSLLSLAEDKKLHDSEFAEEIFDACLKTLHNHRKIYKEQQLLQAGQSQKKQNQGEADELALIQKFELEQEKTEMQKLLFDIKRYNTRSTKVTVAGGLAKQNGMMSQRKGSQRGLLNINASQNQNLLKVNQADANQIKSRSHVPALKKGSSQNKQNDIDLNDIDLEVEDENQNFFIEENFKNAEWYIGVCPFQHWSLYRQQIASILQAHNTILNNKNAAQSQYQKQIYKDMLQKALPKDTFYYWMTKFNPLMYQSGMQWSNLQIKEIVFCQNQQMVSSSGSSVVLSNQNLSHQSLSSTPTSAKEKRNLHLGSYSQILGKEQGGISKQDMSGVVFTWGSDGSGQLGLDILAQSSQPTVNLKVLYPRMVISLRDEIIKEICCGHSHTMAINIYGQVYGWGLNENAQLGLGPEAPLVVRKPALNPYLTSIVKLSAGNEHSLGITKTGELYIWGAGGLTGTGDLNKRSIPTKLDFFNKTKIAHAVCGGLHTIAVTKDGEIYSWGSTEGGQLGLAQSMILNLCQGKEIPVLTPQKIPKLEGQFIVQVASGEAHTIAMNKEGQIFGWGMSNYGQLGLGFSSDSFEPGIGMEKSKVHEPQEITYLKNERITKIICGATFTLFQTDKGDLYGCGMNDLGQLGLDTFMEDIGLEKIKKGKHHQTSDVTIPTRVICFQGIALFNIACGENHALGVSGDEKNMLWAWGMYKNGQLGLGEVTMKMNPRPVQTLCSSQIQRIACGSMHSSALIGDSTQISTFSPQFYVNNEQLSNDWSSDIRGLCFNGRQKSQQIQEDEVPDDGEGKIKNPK